MTHAALERLAPLLEVLRAHPALKEARPATFYLDGQEFLHFHETPSVVFADVLLARGRVHMPVSSAAEQGELLERIDQVLESLESREHRRPQRERRNRIGT